MDYNEVEFKYDAKDIDLDKFHLVCSELTPVSYARYHGLDTFYSTHRPAEFCRYRIGNNTHQLTYKLKTCDENSFARKEVNIELANGSTAEIITEFLKYQGYTKANTIDKVSFVYTYEDFIAAYYICYDKSMKEVGRFIEIEAREDRELGDDAERLSWLAIIEKNFKSLGVSPKNRINLNLYEMFGKTLTK